MSSQSRTLPHTLEQLWWKYLERFRDSMCNLHQSRTTISFPFTRVIEMAYSEVWNNVNFNRNTPGILTLNLAKMTNCPICPSNPLNLSGVCTTSPADASAPVGVLTGVYVFGESESSGWGWTIDARIKNRVMPDSASLHVLVYQLVFYIRDQGTHALSSSSSTTGGGSTGRRSTRVSAWRPSFFSH
jgi:hypothetical protein